MRRQTAWGPVLGLLFLAPVCAEYLLGYDETTGDWLALLGGLLVLGPLYGAPAILIREIARRTGGGIATMLCLAAAWGIVEAGLVDQSMFNPAYRNIAYWDALWSPTRIAGLDVSAFAAWTFVLGHVVFSLVGPIVIIEALARRRSSTLWLSRPGLVVVGFLGVAGGLVVWVDHMSFDTFRITPVQAIAALIAAGAFVAAGIIPRARSHRTSRPVPPAVVIAIVAFAAAVVVQLLARPSWIGFGTFVALTATAFATLTFLSASTRWDDLHRVAAAGGALLGSAAAGWFIDPIGVVPPAERFAHHLVLSVLLLVVVALAARRMSGGQGRACAAGDPSSGVGR